MDAVINFKKKNGILYPSLGYIPFQCDSEAPHIKRCSLFLYSLNWGWPCDLVWLIKCWINGIVLILSIGLKKTWVLLFSLLELWSVSRWIILGQLAEGWETTCSRDRQPIPSWAILKNPVPGLSVSSSEEYEWVQLRPEELIIWAKL